MVFSRILIVLFFLSFGLVHGEEDTTEEEVGDGGRFLNVTLSPDCRRDVQEIVRGLRAREEWALQIVDSMEKIPSGLLMGRSTAYGQFEECLKVVHPNISAKHCVLNIDLKQQVFNMTDQEIRSVLGRLRSQRFGYGVCMPSTCSHKDLENAAKALGLNEIVTTEAEEESCTTTLHPELRVEDYFAIVLFLFLILLAAVGTAYEVYTSDRKTDGSEILKSFSLRSNLKTLFETSEKPQEIDSLHGIRFFSFTWLILGHLYSATANFENMSNPIDLVKTLTQKSHIAGTNSFLCVDTYFFLSGFLVCLIFFRNVSKTGSFDFFVALIHRYWRLTPAFMALLLFQSTLLSRLTVGPYVRSTLESVESDCRNNWWAYILYVQNPIHKGNDKCFLAAWYLCADMQMYLFSPLVLYVLLLKPRFGPVYLIALTLASTLASFVFSYVEAVAPNPVFQFAWDNTQIYTYEYNIFPTRMAPWLVGIGSAYILCGIKNKKISFHLSRYWVITGWLTAATVALSSLYGVAAFYPVVSSERSNLFGTSCYRALHRLGWSLSLSWVVLASVNNCGGIINKFLSCQAFKPLGRLTYCAYLNHVSMQVYRNLNGLKTLKYYTTFELIHTYLGDICISLGIALPMTLLVEMPFARVERILSKNLVIFPYPKSKRLKEPFAKDIEKEMDTDIKNENNGWTVEEKNKKG